MGLFKNRYVNDGRVVAEIVLARTTDGFTGAVNCRAQSPAESLYIAAHLRKIADAIVEEVAKGTA